MAAMSWLMRGSAMASCKEIALGVGRADGGQQDLQLVSRLAQRIVHEEMGDPRMPRGPAHGDGIEIAVEGNALASARNKSRFAQHVAPAQAGETQRQIDQRRIPGTVAG